MFAAAAAAAIADAFHVRAPSPSSRPSSPSSPSFPSARATTSSNARSSSARIFAAKARMSDACIGPRVSVSASKPSNAPACTAAPSATTSSGSTSPGLGFRPNVFSTNRRTAGVFVAPPTSKI